MCLCGACCACVEAAACLACCCSLGSNRTAAKYIYAALFAVATLLAWIVRDYSQAAVDGLKVFEGCDGDRDCLGVRGVLRISFGLSIFFALMFITTVGTLVTEDWRDRWNSGWWPLKFILWFLFSFLSFWIPSDFFQVYAEVARFGAGLFLVIQIISIINFVYVWNDSWLENEDKCKLPLIIVSLISYILVITGIILMYIWFAPRPTCGLNIFFITFALFLVIVMTGISLHPQVQAGLMTSGCLAVYVIYLCWAAIMSEPISETCNTRPRANGQGTFVVIIGFILGFAAIIIATFSLGIDSRAFSLQKKEEPGEGEVPYGYGFFHLVFTLGSMYMAMLFLGWDLEQTSVKWSLSKGWISVWVQIVTSWIAAGLYIWTMVGRFILTDRDFG